MKIGKFYIPREIESTEGWSSIDISIAESILKDWSGLPLLCLNELDNKVILVSFSDEPLNNQSEIRLVYDNQVLQVYVESYFEAPLGILEEMSGYDIVHSDFQYIQYNCMLASVKGLLVKETSPIEINEKPATTNEVVNKSNLLDTTVELVKEEIVVDNHDNDLVDDLIENDNENENNDDLNETQNEEIIVEEKIEDTRVFSYEDADGADIEYEILSINAIEYDDDDTNKERPYYSLAELIPNKTTITHNLYGTGVYKGKNGNTAVIKFDNGVETNLGYGFYNKSWFVKNLTGYSISGMSRLSQRKEFETNHFKAVEAEIAKQRKGVEDKIEALPLPDMEDPAYARQIAKEKMNLQYQVGQLRNIQNKPYFARFDIYERDNDMNAATFYIGENAFGNSVIDWRSPEAQPYYQQDLFTNKLSEYQLDLIRTFDIQNRVLNKIEDQYDGKHPSIGQNVDSRLSQLITHNRLHNIKNIVSSIQKNQYKIITHNYKDNIFVQGCAGSGKTMILAHRLSYWAFRLQKEFNLSDAYIISTSKLMSMEFNRLGLEINRANQLTTNELNKNLIIYFAKQMNMQLDVQNTSYENNSLLNNFIVRDTYSKGTLESFKKAYENITNFTGTQFEKFCNYLDGLFVEKLNKVSPPNVKDENGNKLLITKEDAHQVMAQYGQLTGLLKQLTFSDIRDYQDSVKELDKVRDDHESLKKDYNKSSKEKTNIIKQFVRKYPHYEGIEDINLEDLQLIYEQEMQYYEESKNEVEDKKKRLNPALVDQTIENYENQIATAKENIKSLEQRISNAFALGRRNLTNSLRAEEENLNKLETALNQYQTTIDNLYAENGLDRNDSRQVVLELMKWDAEVNEKKTFLDDVKKVIQVFTLESDSKELLEVFENDNKEMLLAIEESNPAVLDLLKKLTNNRKLLSVVSQDKYSDERVKSICEQFLSVKVKGRNNNLAFVNAYNELLEDDSVVAANEFKNRNLNNSILPSIYSYLIDGYKQEHGIRREKHYSFELFLTLFLISLTDGLDYYRNKWIFIDEVQDYSFVELDLYKKLFKNSSFNYFGDINQRVGARCMSNQQLKDIVNDFSSFMINQNYRNAYEITDYVNKTISMKMLPVGLKGNVNSNAKIDQIGTDTVVICHPNNIDLVCKQLGSKHYNVISDVDSGIKKGAINIFTPISIKGLEFDSVYVFTDKMNKNERYVSYTRAMANLFVNDDAL